MVVMQQQGVDRPEGKSTRSRLRDQEKKATSRGQLTRIRREKKKPWKRGVGGEKKFLLRAHRQNKEEGDGESRALQNWKHTENKILVRFI